MSLDLSAVTAADFKEQFFRDFPYLPAWEAAVPYPMGAVVFYEVDNNFYKANKPSPAGTLPTDLTIWQIAVDDVLNYILDRDIQNAFAQASLEFNCSLFSNEDNQKLGYLYLTAAYLVHDIKQSNEGLASTSDFLVTNRSVGNVSEAYGVPESYLKDPSLNFYTKSKYGLKYLNFVIPYLRGNIQAVAGFTTSQ